MNPTEQIREAEEALYQRGECALLRQSKKKKSKKSRRPIDSG